ncbi:MAG: tetratricopeptide repeat protein [Planctomycetes bacterium]|nr:tetratricopeptide repeat protein [Planctomycetota bacterium]
MRYLLAGLLVAAFSPLALASPVLRVADSGQRALARAQLLAEVDEEEDAGLPDAELALDKGQYKSAKLGFKKVLKEDPANQAAARGLAETYAQTGDYKLGVSTLSKCIEQSDKIEDVTLIRLARLQLIVGDLTAVETLADKLIASETSVSAVDGYLLKGNVLRTKGLYEEAKAEYNKVRAVVLKERGGAMQIDKSKGRQPVLADEWCSAGESYYWLNRLHDANECWGNALVADNYHERTNLWMAQLYLEQNHDSSAHVNYAGPFLKHNSGSSLMHLRMAQIYFFRWRSTAGFKELDEAVKLNPDSPEILSFRAAKFIGTDQYDLGRKDYERALKVNPGNEEALGAKALHAATLGLKDLWNEAEQAMLAVNPKPARFYEIVADGLSDRFRYTEALPLYKKALECNPEHWTAYKGQGMAAMNYGDDELGQKSLEIALDKDPIRNNLQTVNFLTLLDSFKNFERVKTEDGRWNLLVHKSEAPIMVDLYLQHLNDIWEELEKKYDFKPQTPITIESFNRHEDFEVRTVGITGLPALGACFGHLVTLDSPSARPPGSYNWASTLRHEMDHVWQLQISNGQIPRWLAEGCSVYEEKRTRPEWERHMEDQLFMHYHQDDIPSVKKFNEWFHDGSKVLFAYYLGNVMMEFIDKKLGGLNKIRSMIEMFGAKKTPEEVFRACLNMEPEDFDKQFRDYVANERIAHLKMIPLISPGRTDELYFKYEDGEATTDDLVQLALAYTQQGSRFDAETFLGLARKAGADSVMGVRGATYWYCVAMLARNDEDLPRADRTKKMREAIETAIARGLEDYQTYLMMAQFAQQDRNVDMTLHWLKEAQRAFPESAQPYAYMYQIYQQTRDNENAIKAAEKWVSVDENNLNVRMWLIENVYDPGRNWEKMADMALQAVNVAPLSAKVHHYRGYALRKLKDWQGAVDSFEFVRRLATGATPEEALQAEVDALCDIAATWLQAEEDDKCRKALEEAKALDPNNSRIKTIEEELDGAKEEEEEGF